MSWLDRGPNSDRGVGRPKPTFPIGLFFDEARIRRVLTADEVKSRDNNLDFENPHVIADDHGDPEELLVKRDEAEKQTAALREKLKAILAEALL